MPKILFKPGNPGRPKGIIQNKSEPELFAIVVDRILEKTVDLALDGNMHAAAIVLEHYRQTTKKENSK
jgi:hypothetical protein